MTRGRTREALQRRRRLEHVELLCDCGVGLGPIAPHLCSSIKALLGADAASLFWIDVNGVPQGFYHDTAPAELKDLFITRFDELFSGPDEINFTTYLTLGGPSIGRSLEDEIFSRFHRGNIYKHLCNPLNHYYLLDMRIDFEGIGRAVFILWNTIENPFTHADVEHLRPVQQQMERAIGTVRRDARWKRIDGASGHFITGMDGRQLFAIDGNAESILTRSHMLSQHIPMNAQVREAPAFAAALAGMLAQTGKARMEFPVPDGRLVAVANPIRTIREDDADSTSMFVTVDTEVALEVLMVNHLIGLPLTPLQRRIALFAMLGNRRFDCADRFNVSEEAMKKHLRTIFEVTGTANWVELAQVSP